MGTPFTFGIVQSDLENALNVATVLALFDDGTPPNAGSVNQVALTATIVRGEQEMASWLVGQFGLPLPADLATDMFFKSSAIEFCVGYSIERHPEYAKAAGFGTAESYFERATARAERIAAARQQANTLQETPANVGGVVMNGAPRMYVPSVTTVGGITTITENSGDY